MKPAFNPAARPLPATAIAMTEVERWRAENNRALPMTGNDKLTLMADNYAALYMMSIGQGWPEHMATVITAMNIGMVLTEMGFGREYAAAMRAGLDGVWRAKNRGEQTGKWGFDGPGLVAVREAMQVLEAQLEHASRQDLIDAIHTIHERYGKNIVYTTEPA